MALLTVEIQERPRAPTGMEPTSLLVSFTLLRRQSDEMGANRKCQFHDGAQAFWPVLLRPG